MKLVPNKAVTGFALLSFLVTGLFQTAQAVSSFDNKVSVTYTINSITNETNAGSLAGLNIFGDFAAGATSVNTGLGGSVSPAFNDNSMGNIYSYDLVVGGDTGMDPAGFSDASFEQFANLFLENTGTDQYNIDVTLTYSLMAKVFGDNASSSSSLEYASRPPRRGAGTVFEDISVNIGGLVDETLLGSADFLVNLTGVSEQVIFSTMTIDGIAGATIIVPEPNILLLMLISAVGFPVLRRRKV